VVNSQNLESDKKGFFRVDEKNGKWCFVDPSNNSFYSTGIGSISSKSGFSPKLGYSEYQKNIIEKYGNEKNWANVTYDRLVEWGFNSLGGSGPYIRNKGFYYTENLGLADDSWQEGSTTDFFSDDWIETVEKKCKEKITNISDDSNLIGYFLDNEIRWGSDWRSLLDIFDTYMKMDYDSPGKKRLVEFLRNRYDNNISKFNLAWRTDFNHFEEMLYEENLGLWPYTIEARNDHNEFLFIVAEQFFKICHNKIRKYDKNHLILGCRFSSFVTPRKVVEACKKYVDVVSVNHYPPNPLILPFAFIAQDILGFTRATDFLQEYYDITKKPVLISEFYFRARDSGLPNTKPYRILMPVLFNQRQRSICFELQTRGFLEKPFIVGYHWFGYADQPKTGRFDGENSNNGLVNVKDEPYTILVNKMKEINHFAHSIVIDN
jgi:agarase